MADATVTSSSGATQRLDKWLWFARVAKTRTLAAGLVSDGRVRVNRVRVTKPAQLVREGDVVTVSAQGGVMVLRILAGGTRRGPASEARLLYDEVVPFRPPRAAASAESSSLAEPAVQGPITEAGSGRPTKKDRRQLDRLRSLDPS